MKRCHFFQKHSKMADKACHKITLATHTLMDNDSRITETVIYLYTYSSDNHLISRAGRAELQYSIVSQPSKCLKF